MAVRAVRQRRDDGLTPRGRPQSGRTPARLTRGRAGSLPGKGDGRMKEPWAALVCIGRHPDQGRSQPCFRAPDGFWVTTLRAASASVIASPLGPVHLAVVAMRCRESVESAPMSCQRVTHPSAIVDLLRKRPPTEGVAAGGRRTGSMSTRSPSRAEEIALSTATSFTAAVRAQSGRRQRPWTRRLADSRRSSRLRVRLRVPVGPRIDVGVVDRGRPEADRHLARARVGNRNVGAIRERRHIAVARRRHRSHAGG